VYVERKLWAKAKDGDKPAVCKALKRCRLGDYVEETFNTNSLSAYVRELDREGKPLSPALASVLDVSEVFKTQNQEKLNGTKELVKKEVVKKEPRSALRDLQHGDC